MQGWSNSKGFVAAKGLHTHPSQECAKDGAPDPRCGGKRSKGKDNIDGKNKKTGSLHRLPA
jgi:hypothetical protein